MAMASDDFSTLLDSLKVSDSNQTDEEVNCTSEHLEKIISEITKEADRAAICQKFVEKGVLKVALLALKHQSKEAQSRGAELIAELAKVESCRLSCVEEGIVPVLVEKMSCEDPAITVQTCRALGNICYEYDGGRSHVMEAGGGTQLLNLLKRAVAYPDSPENHQLRLVATGFLLNLLNSYETDKRNDPMALMLIDVLVLYLEKFAANEDIPTHVLLSLSCLADADLTRDLVISKNISPHLAQVLKENKSPEVIETCLELILNLAETETVKTQLSVGGICEAVIDIVRMYMDDTSSELTSTIVKTATDLIVLVLVGDESMLTLYGNGEHPVYLSMLKWLTSSSEELQIAGALAMGNFARNDAHCIQMVKTGVAEKLLHVLGAHSTADGDLRLQHAALSALRNLSIAKQNKTIIIEQKVLEVLLPMAADVKTFPVVFKLLATLRMIIDGQTETAIKVGKSAETINRIVEWSSTSEHPGVQGEASRILAWIIKNCGGDKMVIQELIGAGALAPLVTMLASEYPVMVNEAGLGLTLSFSKMEDSSIEKRLEEYKFADIVEQLLKRRDLPPEVIANVVSMLVALSRNASNLKVIQTDEIKSGIIALNSVSSEEVKALVTQLSESLNSDSKATASEKKNA